MNTRIHKLRITVEAILLYISSELANQLLFIGYYFMGGNRWLFDFRDNPIGFQIFFWCCFLLFMGVIRKLFHQQSKRVLKFGSLHPANALLCILVGVGAAFLVNGFLTILASMKFLEFNHVLDEKILQIPRMYMIAGICFAIPVLEELFFRGMLLEHFFQGKVPILGVLLSTLFFGVSHGEIIQAMAMIPLGLVIAIVVIKTRSVLSGMVVHIVYNSVNLYFLTSDLVMDYIGRLGLLLLLGIVLLQFGMAYIRRPKFKD